jgi:hypothetical protein
MNSRTDSSRSEFRVHRVCVNRRTSNRVCLSVWFFGIHCRQMVYDGVAHFAVRIRTEVINYCHAGGKVWQTALLITEKRRNYL